MSVAGVAVQGKPIGQRDLDVDADGPIGEAAALDGVDSAMIGNAHPQPTIGARLELVVPEHVGLGDARDR